MSDEPAEKAPSKRLQKAGKAVAKAGEQQAKARQKRLAGALRDNLRRRKAQQRARLSTEGD
jgi:hypothetical protein